jgi:radical SAM protein with 4Fe4S-binding SPASM domain
LRRLRTAALRVVKKTGLRYEHFGIPRYYLPYLFFAGRAAKAPEQCDFELTYRCNMYCAMCPQVAHRALHRDGGQIRHPLTDPQRSELSTAQIKEALRALAAGGTRLVLFTGGEPFLRKDIGEILAYAKERGLKVTLISNGSLISPEIAAHLVRIGVDALTFSLDGPADLHDQIRQSPDAFARLVASVQLIRAERERQGRARPYLSLSAVIQQPNQTRLADLVDAVGGLGIDCLNFNFPFYTTVELEAATWASLRTTFLKGAKPEEQSSLTSHHGLRPATVVAQLGAARLRAAAYGVKLITSPALLDEEIADYIGDPSYSVVQRCFYAWKTMRVNAWGEVYPCSIDVQLGNIAGQDILAIWNGAPYRAFRRQLKAHGRFPQCAKCCVLTHRWWDRLPSFTKVTARASDHSATN